MRIVIAGAGKTGAFLGAKLVQDHDVTLIEIRSERAERVQAMLSGALVIDGDACEPSTLERAGLSGADLLVAATGDDEDNLVVAMLAREYDVKRVIGRVNHPANEWLFDEEWGIDEALSGPSALWHLVERRCCVSPESVTDEGAGQAPEARG